MTGYWPPVWMASACYWQEKKKKERGEERKKEKKRGEKLVKIKLNAEISGGYPFVGHLPFQVTKEGRSSKG